jgi:hypothetical protein
VRSAFESWRKADEAELLAWVESMGLDGVEPWFRATVGRYAMALSNSDPRAALQWAALMDDDEKRELAQITIVRRWRKMDEAEAESWLRQSPLSEEAREKARSDPPDTLPPRRRRALREKQDRLKALEELDIEPDA